MPAVRTSPRRLPWTDARRAQPILALIGVWLTGCVGANEIVVREQVAGHHLLVELEPVDTETRFSHPVQGQEPDLAQQIDRRLAELVYGRPRGKKLFRLLDVEDRGRLATGLARGLIQADPGERVLFVLRVDDGPQEAWFTPEERFTRGVAFVDLDGGFNLAFDLVDDRVDPNDPDAHDPTERTQTRARIVSETGELVGADDGARRLWVAWRSFAGPRTAEAAVLSGADASKLELLDELLRDGVIDRETYDRRRSRLPTGTSPSPSESP